MGCAPIFGKIYGGPLSSQEMKPRPRTHIRRQRHHRIEPVLEVARGHSRDDYDRRDRDRGPRPRNMDLKRDGRLFDRLAALDYDYLLSLNFSASQETLSLLLPQSVLGRAQNGHGFWRSETGEPLAFREATFDRVLTALEPLDSSLTAHLVRGERGRRLKRLGEYLHANLFTDKLALDDNRMPLLGVEFLRGRTVVTRDFLRGLLLAGWMDDFEQRRMCLSRHRLCFDGSPLEIGGGRSFVVHPEKLAAVGIVDPGRGEFADEDIEKLVELGVIVRDGDRDYSRPTYEQAFFRLRRQDGVCDDLALIWCGAKIGFDAMLGAFVMDAVDTYDKFLWSFREGGVDGRLATSLQEAWRRRYGEPLVRGEEILELIHFAAKLNSPPAPLSSSHRRFIQTEEGSKVPTLLNHWRFVQGDPIYDIELGYNRFPSRKFYDIAWRRLKSAKLQVPAPTYSVRRDNHRRRY
jgi:hypothetical protein